MAKLIKIGHYDGDDVNNDEEEKKKKKEKKKKEEIRCELKRAEISSAYASLMCLARMPRLACVYSCQ